MIYYVRLTAKKDCQKLISDFLSMGASANEIIIDRDVSQKQDGSVYMNLKTHLSQTGEKLCIDSLSSLGKNYREIFKELHWLNEHNVLLTVIDLPATVDEICSAISLLEETYFLLAQSEIENVKKRQKQAIRAAQENQKTLGRTKIPYPEKWEENYMKWERKEISSAEFLKLTGLKKGTFYNLIKQYRASLNAAKEA